MKLFTHIDQLLLAERTPVGLRRNHAMQGLHTISHAWLLVEGGLIKEFGSMDTLSDYKNSTSIKGIEEINCAGKFIMPCFADSHTHLVFASYREHEFVDKINGLTYAQIAERGGGILHSAEQLNHCSEDALYHNAAERMREIMRTGTGAVEIKSGYGLTVEGELKMLRVIQRLKETYPVLIKSTFLGAHAVPKAYKGNKAGYIQLIIKEMLPNIAAEKLADFIDVFCETNYFTPDETTMIMEAGYKYGLRPKIHVNQFTSIGGIQAAVKHQALSVDHLEVMKEEDFEALALSSVIATLLPGCSLFLNIPFAPARKMIDRNIAVALATDFNPGSAPSGNMQLVVALACMQLKMRPEEAIIAASIHGAHAMACENEIGTITPGKKANFILTRPLPSIAYLPYAFGSNHVEQLYINGEAQL
ncbi:MAG: imidazolonepropionase [Flavobacteriales bacterium]|nr:imidazolonepropionase [Flavobacteriales bacterium]